MKVWEICKKENIGKRYKTNACYFVLTNDFNLVCENGRDITGYFPIGPILDFDFEEEIDWAKVKKDTRVLVSDDGIEWNKRYFAYYKGQQVYCYGNGTTSWNYKELELDILPWKYFKLAEEK